MMFSLSPQIRNIIYFIMCDALHMSQSPHIIRCQEDDFSFSIVLILDRIDSEDHAVEISF